MNPQVAQAPLSVERPSEAAEVQLEGEQVHPWVCVDSPRPSTVPFTLTQQARSVRGGVHLSFCLSDR